MFQYINVKYKCKLTLSAALPVRNNFRFHLWVIQLYDANIVEQKSVLSLVIVIIMKKCQYARFFVDKDHKVKNDKKESNCL